MSPLFDEFGRPLPPQVRWVPQPEPIFEKSLERPFKDDDGRWHLPAPDDPPQEPERPHAGMSTEALWERVASDPRTVMNFWSQPGTLKMTVAGEVHEFARELALREQVRDRWPGIVGVSVKLRHEDRKPEKFSIPRE